MELSFTREGLYGSNGLESLRAKMEEIFPNRRELQDSIISVVYGYLNDNRLMGPQPIVRHFYKIKDVMESVKIIIDGVELALVFQVGEIIRLKLEPGQTNHFDVCFAKDGHSNHQIYAAVFHDQADISGLMDCLENAFWFYVQSDGEPIGLLVGSEIVAKLKSLIGRLYIQEEEIEIVGESHGNNMSSFKFVKKNNQENKNVQ